MDGAGASSMAFAGPSSESSTPAVYDEDSASRHFAVTASQVPKPTGSMAPLSPMALPSSSLELAAKDAKSLGTRFYEDCHDPELPSPRLRSSRLFKGKGKEAVSVEREQKKPMQLLDLPVDILKDIVKEVTHTNDLTSLALCHSALHRLTIPQIYSRFDIVWPDTTTHAEPRSGVDALTYGLATLVMAEEVFGEAPNQRQATNNRFAPNGQGAVSEMAIRRRRGNHYAQFTKKFSLGNGPADWVQEYLITKEGGKMLGTLVALAVARMRTLETFIWDMPTGILRDVWLALSSLGDQDDGQPCRLEKVWIRWHDNSSTEAPGLIPPSAAPMGLSMAPSAASPLSIPSTSSIPPQIHPATLDRVEHPSFSVLPHLKSLSVLDIDELAYLDEMAVLIGRSLDKLRELRIGIARHAISKDWVTVWEGSSLQQVDPDYPTFGSLTIGEKRLGGVLGTLTGFVCDVRKPKIAFPDRLKRKAPLRSGSPAKSDRPPAPLPIPPSLQVESEPLTEQSSALNGVSSLRDVLPEVPSDDVQQDHPMLSPLQTAFSSDSAYENDPLIAQSSHASSPMRTPNTEASEQSIFGAAMQAGPVETVLAPEVDMEPEPEIQYLDNTLQLESLELERVPLSVPVLQRAIDWTRLTSLTLLHCQNHEQLWKTLRRTFAPRPKSPTYPHPRRTPTTSPRKGSKISIGGSDIELEYSLNLKKIHTNTVSPALISFLKETLAPNSLQVLFLQEARVYNSSVSVDQIFKGPLRRHRSSLKKLLIDSSEKGPDGTSTSSSRWRRWMLPRDILGFICSGKMPALRELGMAIDYRDWHFFLQHLPSIPHLRSLSIPFLADHVHGANVDPRELALQIVDIVALRPEVEVCYMGIASKCFEILDHRISAGADSWSRGRTESQLGFQGETEPGSDGEEDEEEGAEAEGEEEPAEEPEQVPAEAETESEDDEDADDDTESDGDGEDIGGGKGTARLRLREILFYDDKVAVFKARHGRL